MGKKTLTFKVAISTDETARVTAWQRYIKDAITEMFDMMGDGEADDEDFDLVDFHEVTVDVMENVITTKWRIKIDGHDQGLEFIDEESADGMIEDMERQGVQPELIEKYVIKEGDEYI